MTPEEKEETVRLAMDATKHLPWVPNPGYQTMALCSEADELFFGGELGPGKTSLLVGCALTQHTKSMIFRREFAHTGGLEDELTKILGSRDGYSSHPRPIWRIPNTNKTIEFGYAAHEKDVERYQGRAHDFKGFDEITHFSKAQYQYLCLWLRSTVPGQRCRIIAAGNRPQRPEGLWVYQHWAAWLDPTYHDPAGEGELRWPVPIDDESDKELFCRSLDDAMRHLRSLKNPPIDPTTQEIAVPRSRAFIPGKLAENLEQAGTGYGRVLAYAPKPLRALAAGDFESAIPDDEWQCIPTQWIIEAQKRWTNKYPHDVPMVAMGVDVAQGGNDQTVLAWRHDCWYAPLVAVDGAKTPNPSDVAALIVRHRRDGAAIIVDCGGGYGGGVCERLSDNQINATKYIGAGRGFGRTKRKEFGFANKRAESWWRLREALDPDQPGGSPIALPDDPALRADLCAPRYEISTRSEIKVEAKEETKKRIGRSPDRGDAVVMAWSEGERAIRRNMTDDGGRHGGVMSAGPLRQKYANVGYESAKKRRRH